MYLCHCMIGLATQVKIGLNLSYIVGTLTYVSAKSSSATMAIIIAFLTAFVLLTAIVVYICINRHCKKKRKKLA